MKTPKISVLMSAYNSQAFIAQAIESILNQTFTDFEFIIVDDGSTDGTADIIKKYARADNRIRYLYKENGGITAALNYGWDYCRGEFIARMDADDISLPTRFQEQIEYMTQNPDVAVLGAWFEMFGTRETKVMQPTDIGILDILRGHHVGHPTVMMRRELMDKYHLRYDENFKTAQDFELWSRVVRVLKVQNLPKILLRYRMSKNNISTARADEQRRNAETVKANTLNFLTSDTTLQQQILDLVTGKNNPKVGILLPKWLGHICCWFIPNHRNRKNFRKKYVRG